jgi:peptide-methionine (S)-S-oxide reductase
MEVSMEPICDIRGAALKPNAGGFPDPELDLPPGTGTQTAVFAAGCFWCVEAVFRELDGVIDVVSGYAGGSASTADYESVCSGGTDHAEVVKIDYDPTRISYGRLLKVLFSVAHDPTQLNRQGNDRGRQYRSAVFYASEHERKVVAAYISQLDAAGVFKAPIVTQLSPLTQFYRAETYHQDYAARNPDQPYIAMVSTPKVEKLRKTFAPLLKK